MTQDIFLSRLKNQLGKLPPSYASAAFDIYNHYIKTEQPQTFPSPRKLVKELEHYLDTNQTLEEETYLMFFLEYQPTQKEVKQRESLVYQLKWAVLLALFVSLAEGLIIPLTSHVFGSRLPLDLYTVLYTLILGGMVAKGLHYRRLTSIPIRFWWRISIGFLILYAFFAVLSKVIVLSFQGMSFTQLPSFLEVPFYFLTGIFGMGLPWHLLRLAVIFLLPLLNLGFPTPDK